MTDRFDILIVELATARVSSIAAYAIPDTDDGEIQRVVESLRPRLKHGLTAEAHPAGEFQKGDILPFDGERAAITRHLPDKPPRASRDRTGDTYSKSRLERMANGQCIRCGSTELVTSIHCEPCRQFVRNRAALTRANSL